MKIWAETTGTQIKKQDVNLIWLETNYLDGAKHAKVSQASWISPAGMKEILKIVKICEMRICDVWEQRFKSRVKKFNNKANDFGLSSPHLKWFVSPTTPREGFCERHTMSISHNFQSHRSSWDLRCNQKIILALQHRVDEPSGENFVFERAPVRD